MPTRTATTSTTHPMTGSPHIKWALHLPTNGSVHRPPRRSNSSTKFRAIGTFGPDKCSLRPDNLSSRARVFLVFAPISDPRPPACVLRLKQRKIQCGQRPPITLGNPVTRLLPPGAEAARMPYTCGIAAMVRRSEQGVRKCPHATEKRGDCPQARNALPIEERTTSPRKGHAPRRSALQSYYTPWRGVREANIKWIR